MRDIERPDYTCTVTLTHIARGPTGCGHDAARILDLRQTKVTDHDLGVLVHAVVQQVLRLPGEGWGKDGKTSMLKTYLKDIIEVDSHSKHCVLCCSF